MSEIKPIIIVVAYRRVHTLARLLKSIAAAYYKTEDITLIISIDYHPENQDVVKLADDFEWEHGTKIVNTHTENLGLKKHIIQCADYSMEYGGVILLEDDELVAPGFYEYAKKALNKYADDDRVAGVSLYGREWNDYECGRFQPIMTEGDNYFGQFSCTWGEAWTGKQWNEFKEWYANNPEIKEDELLPPPIYTWNKSWGKYFVRFLVETGKYYCIPRKPMSTVYGEVGTHSVSMELDKQISLYLGTDELELVDFEKGCHYDTFFENVDLKKKVVQIINDMIKKDPYFDKDYEVIEDSATKESAAVDDAKLVSTAEVTIDIYGLRDRKYATRYILTTNQLNYKILKSYDLNLRPHEMNVILDMEGRGIYLYDSEQKADNKEVFSSDNSVSRLEYDFAGLRGPEAVEYGIKHIAEIVKKKFDVK